MEQTSQEREDQKDTVVPPQGQTVLPKDKGRQKRSAESKAASSSLSRSRRAAEAYEEHTLGEEPFY